MVITVVGLGLIGGSFGKSLKSVEGKYHIIGVDRSKQHEQQALNLGLVDECLTMREALAAAEVVLLAMPVNTIRKDLSGLLDEVRQDQLIIDFGSTKQKIAESVVNHEKRSHYLSAHPMAGTENTGPEAAFQGLYDQKILIACDTELTNATLLQKGLALFNELGMNIIYMDSESHDRHIAYVSHLSHVSSFMLGATVLDMEKDETSIFNMAGSGFRSTVRLAMSSPEMWAPIFLQNKDNILKALSEYIESLNRFEMAIQEDDIDSLLSMMREANQIKKVLKKERNNGN